MEYRIVYILLGLALSSAEGINVRPALEKANIVPEIINTTHFIQLLQVSYEYNEVDLGNELTAIQTKDKPTVTWESDYDYVVYYALYMINTNQFRHWVVGNISGNQFDKGVTYVEYVGAGPRPELGTQTYVFLLFKQPKKLGPFPGGPVPVKNSVSVRSNYNMAEEAKKYSLELVAANYFVSKFDEKDRDYINWLQILIGFPPLNPN